MTLASLSRLALAAAFAAGAAPSYPTYSRDGRLPLAALYARFQALSGDARWQADTVYAYPDASEGPIRAWRTQKRGPALWLLAGIHGEEPAGPNALAREVGRLRALAAEGVPVVLLPLCNPKGYRRDWRYPNTAERDWRKGGYSVGDSEYLLPGLDDASKPRAAKPVGPETAALTSYALRLTQDYPPALVIDMHEDELSTSGGYIYAQGARSKGSAVGARLISLLRASGIPIRLSGKTRFGEPVVDGVVDHDDKGLPIRDGSIDELFASTTVFHDGKAVPGPAAPQVYVIETPAFHGERLAARVRADRAILRRLPELWKRAAKP